MTDSSRLRGTFMASGGQIADPPELENPPQPDGKPTENPASEQAEGCKIDAGERNCHETAVETVEHAPMAGNYVP